MSDHAFGRHSSWKRPAARQDRQRNIARQAAARRDDAFWEAHATELARRMADRVSPQAHDRAQAIADRRRKRLEGG